ncbi:MAG: response regulator [Lachnospiraceae bacterium]|nr:response regulator [Lachnospiraceae bacterium]
MRVLAVEDEVILLGQLTNRIREALPEAEIEAYDNADDALAALPRKAIDIAFLDIEIGYMSGVGLAKRIKAVYPHCDIVFCTGYADYAPQAFELGASDYLMKPVTAEKIEHALLQLRHTPVFKGTKQGLFIQCFGDFEVFYDGEPVISFPKRSKELLAFLINKEGVLCPSSEISNALFRGSSDSYLRVAKRALKRKLIEMGQEGVLVCGWGVMGVNRKEVSCDFFDYLDGKPGALNLYKGAYMSQYEWARKKKL